MYQTIYCTIGLIGCIASLGIFDDITNFIKNFSIGKVVTALGEFNLDLSPVGFYDSFTSTTTAGKNDQLAAWLRVQAERFSGKDLNATTARAELKNMTWGDIRAPKGTTWVNYGKNDSIDTKFTKFLEFVTDVLYPLNPILAFLLSGQDIILFDELKLQGENGYSKGVVAILEALMLDEATMSQTSFDNFVYTAVVGQDPTVYTNANDVNVDNLSKGTITKDGETITKRFAVTKNSPLMPLMMAIKMLLIGKGEAGTEGYVAGLLDAPLTVLFTRLPNIVYNLYIFKGENGKNTCNFSIAVKNLIAPVTKILDIVDPVLSRLVKLDINELLDSFLDIEALLNNLINGLITNDEQAAQSSAAIFDFGQVAADSSTINLNQPTFRDGMTEFTRFVGSPGKFFITIVRSLFASQEIANFLGDFIAELAGCYDPAQNVTEEQKEDSERIINLIDGIIGQIAKTDPQLEGGMPVDSIISIIIDVFTDYEAESAELYFYEIINRLEDTTLEQQKEAMEGDEKGNNIYGIKHEGYDWANKPKDENGKLLFTEEKVNATIENLDYVIRKAVPEVLSTLEANGVVGGDLVNGLKGDEGLWGLVKGLALDYVLHDDGMTWLANLFTGLLGSSGDSGTTGVIQQALKAAGFDITFDAFLYDDNGNRTALYDYFTYGFDKNADGSLKAVPADDPAAGLDMYYVNGVPTELTWTQVYKNHSVIRYDYNETTGEFGPVAVQVQVNEEREETNENNADIKSKPDFTPHIKTKEIAVNKIKFIILLLPQNRKKTIPHPTVNRLVPL